MTKSRRKVAPTNGGAPDAVGEPAAAAAQPHDERVDEDERIRARAYEIYLERGGVAGGEMDDWLQAEREYRRRPV